MSKYLENKKSMYLGVKTFFAENMDKATSLPALTKAIADFNQVVGLIETKALEVDAASAGKAKKKANAEEELLTALIPVKSALAAYASEKNDSELKALTEITESQLRKMRDTDLQKKAEGILKNGEERLTLVGDYGLTQMRLTTLQEKSRAFSDATGEREASVGKRVGARSALMELYDRADRILVERIDNLMKQLRDSDPQVCEEYDSTRIVREAGLRHRPIAPPDQQSSQRQP
jgi:CRISPR/Cas system CSM-associated protein Csm2 small subunit